MGRKEVWVQGGAHSKRVVRKKPIPENRRVKSRGHAPVPAGRTKKTHPNTYVSISAIRPYATKKLGGVQWYVFRRRKIMTDERKTKRQQTQDARKEGEGSTMDDQQLDRRGT